MRRLPWSYFALDFPVVLASGTAPVGAIAGTALDVVTAASQPAVVSRLATANHLAAVSRPVDVALAVAVNRHVVVNLRADAVLAVAMNHLADTDRVAAAVVEGITAMGCLGRAVCVRWCIIRFDAVGGIMAGFGEEVVIEAAVAAMAVAVSRHVVLSPVAAVNHLAVVSRAAAANQAAVVTVVAMVAVATATTKVLPRVRPVEIATLPTVKGSRRTFPLSWQNRMAAVANAGNS